jgi:hypothetical protein
MTAHASLLVTPSPVVVRAQQQPGMEASFATFTASYVAKFIVHAAAVSRQLINQLIYLPSACPTEPGR